MKKVKQEDIEKMKSELPRGYTKKLAHKFGISKQAVSQHINSGNIQNDVFKAALEMREDNIKEIEKRKKQLANL